MTKKAVTIALILSLLFCGTSFAAFYRYNIDDLANKARKKIQEIEKRIEEEEVKGELIKILVKIKGLFMEAEELFILREYEEAAELYSEIIEIGTEKEVKKWMQKASAY